MIPPAPEETSLSGLLEWLVQWAMASPVEAAIVIGGALGLSIVSLVLCLRLGRWVATKLFHLGIWIGTSVVAVLGDLGRRWREPSEPPFPSAAEVSDPNGASPEHISANGREYLRVRPTSAEYDVEALVTALDGLNSTHQRTEISGNWRLKEEDVLEFLVATPGPDAGTSAVVFARRPRAGPSVDPYSEGDTYRQARILVRFWRQAPHQPPLN